MFDDDRIRRKAIPPKKSNKPDPYECCVFCGKKLFSHQDKIIIVGEIFHRRCYKKKRKEDV